MENNGKYAPKIRFAYLDNLRSLVIVLVITGHSAVTYSGFGFWPYREASPGELSFLESTFFGFYTSFLQAWGLGILFFTSAFFSTKALAKRGPLKFMRERLFRLGLPLLIYVFVISPIVYFVLIDNRSEYGHNYLGYLLNFKWLGAIGPLWFVEVLLIFCIIYAGVKAIVPKPIVVQSIKTKSIVSAILLTTIAAFLIRLVFPIGTKFLYLQVTYFASYIVLFIAGVIVGESNLLEQINKKQNIRWLKLALIIGIPFWGLIMIFGGSIKGYTYIYGGFYWQSFAYALWESFTAIGFSIGLIAFLKEYLNKANRFSKILAENSFGMYVFHAPILIATSLLLKHLEANLFLKFITAALIAYFFTFLFTFIIRKIKPLGIIFK